MLRVLNRTSQLGRIISPRKVVFLASIRSRSSLVELEKLVKLYRYWLGLIHTFGRKSGFSIMTDELRNFWTRFSLPWIAVDDVSESEEASDGWYSLA
jgi:hypothetical protein